MDRLVQLGMEPLDVIKAATSRAAELLQIEDRTGVVKPGLEADLLTVERNPFEHIRTLQDPLAIISNGRIVLNRVLEEAR
jgi:imidazolonepropionase-like amidohydrolase